MATDLHADVRDFIIAAVNASSYPEKPDNTCPRRTPEQAARDFCQSYSMFEPGRSVMVQMRDLVALIAARDKEHDHSPDTGKMVGTPAIATATPAINPCAWLPATSPPTEAGRYVVATQWVQGARYQYQVDLFTPGEGWRMNYSYVVAYLPTPLPELPRTVGEKVE